MTSALHAFVCPWMIELWVTTLDVSMNASYFLWTELTTFFYISVFMLPLQIETRRRPKVKNCLVLRCGNLAATPVRVISLILFHPARGLFPSTTFVCSPSSPLFTLSSPLASAVLLYLRHSGIKLRDSKVFPGLSTEKEKWLAFLKTKKVRVPAALWKLSDNNTFCCVICVFQYQQNSRF